jgi:hypothetical protein
VVLVHLGLLALTIPFGASDTVQSGNIFSFFGYLLPAAFLAALWTWDLTFSLSKALLQLIDSGGPDETENLSLQPAYLAAQQSELSLALSLLKPKLLAEPGNYEALLLKARLHRRLNHKWRAKLALKRILRHPHLSAAQRQQVGKMLRDMNDSSEAGWQLKASHSFGFPLEEQAEESEPGPW